MSNSKYTASNPEYIHIYWNLHKKMEYMQEFHPELNIVAIFLQGSQNYGLSDAFSDIDVKAVCIPHLDDLIAGKREESHVYVMPDDSHVEVKDIRLFAKTLLKQNPSYLELLETPFFIYSKQGVWLESLLNQYKSQLFEPSSQMVNATFGMFCQKEKETFATDGIDSKALSHLFRLAYMLHGLANGKTLDQLYLLPEDLASKLLSIKRGDYIPPEVEIQKVISDTKSLYKTENTLHFSDLSKDLSVNLMNNIQVELKEDIVLDEIAKILKRLTKLPGFNDD